MALRFDDIPDAASESPGAPASSALSALATTRHSRRRFIRYVGVAGATLGAAALSLAPRSWGPFGAQAAMAEVDPLRGYSEWGTSGAGCTEYHINDYAQANDSSGAYTSGNGYGGACHGLPISHNNCRWGWHLNPRNDICIGDTGTSRNAWRWLDSSGRTWRCSDGHNPSGVSNICRQRVA